jgi:mono/diheme cytochrome c family protein
MISTITLLAAGPTAGHKLGLALVGAAFIVFALVSAFVLPRRNPNFPGRAMSGYVAVCVLFFVAMMAAVLIFGKESKATGNEAAARTTNRAGSLPGQTTTGAATTTNGGGGRAATTTAGGSSGGGDAAAGKKVFASAGCSACHTLKAAGASGTVGPNLDQLKPSLQAVQAQVNHGGGGMPAFKGQLSDKQILDVATYVSSVAGS